MKKGFTIKAILLVLVVALTCGCVKVEVGLKITNSDVSFTYVMGMQKAYISMMNGEGDPFKESTDSLKDSGFTVEDYSDDAYQGKKATKKLGTLEELSTEEELKTVSLSADKLNDVKLFQKTGSGFFKTTYKASFKTNAMDDVEKMMNNNSFEEDDEDIDTEPELDDDDETLAPDEAEEPVVTTGVEEDEEEDEDLDVTTTGSDDLEDLGKELTENMVVNFVVELPSAPGKNNATKVDGKTLIWDLKTFKDGTIEFEFSTLNMTNVLLVGGGALLLLLIVIAIIVIATKKKGKKEPVAYASEPIPEVVKDEAVTPIGDVKVEVEAPATEEAKVE